MPKPARACPLYLRLTLGGMKAEFQSDNSLMLIPLVSQLQNNSQMFILNQLFACPTVPSVLGIYFVFSIQ